MLHQLTLSKFSARFGVSDDQIRRDHLVSHVLAALSEILEEGAHFYGGTALCRTYLPDSRLSEDIDLLSANFEGTLESLAERLPRHLRREFPGAILQPGAKEGLGRQANLVSAERLQLKIYVGAAHVEHPSWRFQPTAVNLRYPDLPESVSLSCPTLATFTAMKWSAYVDRHAPRDLFDLAGLSRIGGFNRDSEAILEKTTGVGFMGSELRRIPGSLASTWVNELSHQVADLPNAEKCREQVLSAVETYLARKDS